MVKFIKLGGLKEISTIEIIKKNSGSERQTIIMKMRTKIKKTKNTKAIEKSSSKASTILKIILTFSKKRLIIKSLMIDLIILCLVMVFPKTLKLGII